MLESQIFDKLKAELKQLIPVEGLRIDLRWRPRTGRQQQVDFGGLVVFQKLRFELVGEIVGQGSSPAFNNKINKLKALAGSGQKGVPVIVAPYLSPPKQALCKRAGMNFLDLSGNVFLAYESLYVERLGFPSKFPESREGRDPFSDKASLVLRLLLHGGSRAWGVREIAQQAGLDPGFVSRMAKELERREYIMRSDAKLKLRDPNGVLADWVRGYDFRKNRSSYFFCLAKEPAELMAKLRHVKGELPNHCLALHAGASLVAPYATFNEVHVYIETPGHIASFKKALELTEVTQGANLILMVPFYTHSVWYDSREIGGLEVVSDLQLYLDLYNYPLRGREQADHIYRSCLAQFLEE
ncbi:MAG: helix-turn-helix domain-containing protein [Desulfobacterales bacterium]|nr:helix-turn-helix domain-containing protein [Desulfobacterales bacterium]